MKPHTGTLFVLASLIISLAFHVASGIPFDVPVILDDTSIDREVELEETLAPSPPPPCKWLPPVQQQDLRPQPLAFTPEPTNEPVSKNIVLFTDGTNFDDVATILYLMKAPDTKLLAVYMQGNAWASVGSSFRNIFNIFHMMGDRFNDVPIFAGSYFALVDELEANRTGQPAKLDYRLPVPPGPDGIVYSDTMHGMAPYVPQGPRVYDIRRSPDNDGKSIPAFFDFINALPTDMMVTFLSVGSLTPIAKMFMPPYVVAMEAILPKIDKLVVMGGAVDVPGNLFPKPTNDKAEFNIYSDPHAAQWAFKNLTDRGLEVVLVPLDATNDAPFEERLFSTLRDEPLTPEAQLAGEMIVNLRDTWFDPEEFFSTAYLWDVSAAIVAVDRGSILKQTKTMVRVVTEEGPDGPNQGWTKPCDEMEIDMGLCAELTVIRDIDGRQMNDELVNVYQSLEQTAERGLVCL